MSEMKEPFTQLQEGAARWHEAYLTFHEAGFSEEQAFAIILSAIQIAISTGIQSGAA